MKKEWTFRPDQMAESLSEADAFVENTTMERRYRIKLSLLIEELLLREQVAERYTKQLSDVIEVPLILKKK